MARIAARRTSSAHTYRLLIFKEQALKSRCAVMNYGVVFRHFDFCSKDRDYDQRVSACQVRRDGNYGVGRSARVLCPLPNNVARGLQL
jgi:hypothetical protein